MRIAAVETFPIGLPFRERYVTASGSLERREMVILRLRSSDDALGYGDAVPLSLRGGPALAAVRSELDRPCARILKGGELDADGGLEDTGRQRAALLDRCVEAGVGPQALAAVDAALLDLLGKLHGAPAWRLLGAARAEAVLCNGTLGGGEPEDVGAGARALAARGFGTLKVKVGTGADVARVAALRAAAGAEVRLRVDANGAWSVERAAEMLQAMAPSRLELAEQPCADLEGLAALRRQVDVPLVADESVATAGEAERAFALDACDAVTIKLAKVGGARSALRVAETGPAYLSSALDSPLGIAAAAHTAQALPGKGFAAGLAHGLATSGMFSDNIADPAPLSGPRISLPDAPGLGVEVDEAALERLRLP